MARNADGRLELFAIETDGDLWQRWQLNPNGGWSEWKKALDAQGKSLPVKEIEVAQNADGRLEVFAIETDNELWHRWQIKPNDNTWSHWSKFVGFQAKEVAISRNADGRLEAFATGLDNKLRHNWQKETNGPTGWNGWRMFSEFPVIESEVKPPVTSDPPLHSNPTDSNPLLGFRDPLNGVGSVTRDRHGSNPNYRSYYAIDIAAGIGQPVYAMRSGTVRKIRESTPDLPVSQKGTVDNGNFVLIELDDNDGTNDGYRALYLHLQQNSVIVEPGQYVTAGQMIGRTGHNGVSTGPHLHVEINKPYSSSPQSINNHYGPTVPFEIAGR